jgi:hypothetical protein
VPADETAKQNNRDKNPNATLHCHPGSANGQPMFNYSADLGSFGRETSPLLGT